MNIFFWGGEYNIYGESLACTHILTVDDWGQTNYLFSFHFFRFGQVERKQTVGNPWGNFIFSYISQAINQMDFEIQFFINVKNIRLRENFRNDSKRTRNVLKTDGKQKLSKRRRNNYWNPKNSRKRIMESDKNSTSKNTGYPNNDKETGKSFSLEKVIKLILITINQ